MIIYVSMCIYYSSGILMACCKTVKSLFNIDIDVVVLLVGIIITIFTSFGGLRSVIYIDALQGVCMIGILIFMINSVFCKISGDSFEKVISFGYDWLKINETINKLSHFGENVENLNSNNPYSYIFGASIMCLNLFSLTEGSLQRYNSLKSENSVKKTLFSFMIILYFCLFLTCTYGLFIVYYYKNVGKCDPESVQNIAIEIMEVIEAPKGTRGLLVSMMLVAGVSTISTYVLATQNTISSIMRKKSLNTESKTGTRQKNSLQNRNASCDLSNKPVLISFSIGIFTTLLSILISNFEGNLLKLAINILSYAGSPVSIVLIFSMFDKHKRYFHPLSILLSFILTSVFSFGILLSKTKIISSAFFIEES